MTCPGIGGPRATAAEDGATAPAPGDVAVRCRMAAASMRVATGSSRLSRLGAPARRPAIRSRRSSRRRVSSSESQLSAVEPDRDHGAFPEETAIQPRDFEGGPGWAQHLDRDDVAGPAGAEPGGADALLSVRKGARAQALCTAAILEAAGLLYDDLMEAQLGDAIFFGDLVDLSIFGSKTDPLSVGQTAVMPTPAAPNSGPAALREGTLLDLHRLRALPGPVRMALAARFRASLTPRAGTRGNARP